LVGGKKGKGKRGGGCTASGYGEIHKRKDTTTIIVCLDRSRNAIREAKVKMGIKKLEG